MAGAVATSRRPFQTIKTGKTFALAVEFQSRFTIDLLFLMEHYPRFFTPEQANQLLEVLRPLVAEMLDIRTTVLELQPQLEVVLNKAINNGGSAVSAAALEAFEALKKLLYDIQQYDVFVKDVNLGLIDFPSIRDGEVVFLCWQYGEEDVRFWHDLENGFQDRKLL
jgi:hypothetical protein